MDEFDALTLLIYKTKSVQKAFMLLSLVMSNRRMYYDLYLY